MTGDTARRILAAMRLATILATISVVLLAAPPLSAQDPRKPMKPAAPGTAGDPVWQGVLRSPDGRTFVTDGGLVIDAALAKPAKLPGREIPPKVLQDYFALAHTAEYGFGDFHADATGKTYSAPNGVALSATYVSFLRKVLPRSARFRVSGSTQPVVILAGGTPVGAVMPVVQ